MTLNFWMTEFVGEIGNRSGGLYPPRSLYQIVCGINRHVVCHVNGEDAWSEHVSEGGPKVNVRNCFFSRTQLALNWHLASRVHSVVKNVAANASFNNCSINSILNSKKKL